MAINVRNVCLMTDSYKEGHFNMMDPSVSAVYSYFESRNGAKYPYTVFFGLQAILKQHLAGVVVTQADIEEADELCTAHLGPNSFNRKGWQHIVDNHGGKLPLRIKAVPEGTPVPVSNVLMTVESTDPKCYWLTNFVESLLTHIWYSSNVATVSRYTKEMISGFLDRTADSSDGLPFMLHDFGYRSASSHESAAIGGAGHLINFLGTDTIPAMQFARKYYGASLDDLAYSVAATEHSVMTQLGPEGEITVLDRLLDLYPSGILSVVSDSYDIYSFVEEVGKRADRIKDRDGVFVVRPDSVTRQHVTPEALTASLVERLDRLFGSEKNSKGFKVLDSHIRVLWGDGIDYTGIQRILEDLEAHGYSAENLVFGMGGHLLQVHNRDTQRSAFKSSSQKRDGQWIDVWKKPLDLSKQSKRGRLSLIEHEGKMITVSEPNHRDDIMKVVFENGVLLVDDTFDEIRNRAALPALTKA